MVAKRAARGPFTEKGVARDSRLMASIRPFLLSSLPGEDPAIQKPQHRGFLKKLDVRVFARA
jgi:hypothetical protein